MGWNLRYCSLALIKGHLSSTEPKGHVFCRLLSSTPLSSVTPGLCAVPSTAHLSEGPAGWWHHLLIIYCVPRVPGLALPLWCYVMGTRAVCGGKGDHVLLSYPSGKIPGRVTRLPMSTAFQEPGLGQPQRQREELCAEIVLREAGTPEPLTLQRVPQSQRH